MDTKTRNKLIAALSYISILWLVGYISEKNNDIVFFHSKQGLILFIFNLIGNFIIILLSGSIIGVLFSFIFSITSLGFTILGIYNAVLLKKEKLPIIGSIID